jgi:ketosteroid isomerase-like protein
MNDTKHFLREFNEHWIREDTRAIVDAVTDDIRFAMAGGRSVSGKADFKAFLEEMGGGATDMGLEIASVLVDGDRAAVNGEISMTDRDGQRRLYAFCDIYRLERGKVAELTAYVHEVTGDQQN